MAEYYNERSLLQGSTVPQMDIGALTKAGSLVAGALGSIRDREIENSKLAKEQARYEREQLLNQRADQEWNREIGLRDARKNIAAEFTASPYAAKFGSGKETAELDKQVLDYVNNGGEINEDLAKRLQARYEEALPFREDAANSIASRMIALGEDPTKAKQEADVLASGQLKSRAEKQAVLDSNQQTAQKYYDEWAKANLEAAKMNVDIGKANLNADTDLTKLKLQAGIGGTGNGSTGGFGGNWGDAQETIEKMKFGGIDTYFDAKPFLKTAESMGYSPNQAVWALKQGADLGLIDKTFDVEKSKAFLQKMAPMQTGTGGTRLDMAVSGTQFMPQFAPKQIAGYDPKGFLEGSRSTLPELFRGDPTKIKEETKVSAPVSTTGKYDGNYSTAVKKIETGSKAGDYSSVNRIGAMGAYQFTPDTLEYVNKITGNNVSKEEFLKNPKLQDEYFKVLTEANKNVLSQRGVVPTDFNAWAAHNLGAGSVRKLLDTSTPADPILTRFIKNNVPEGVEPTKENYIKRYAPMFGTTLEEVTNKSNVGVNPLIGKNAENRAKALGLDWSQPNSQVVENVGGIGSRVIGKTPEQKAQRIAEINQMLGNNPAINEETQALINERASLSPKKTNLEAIQREILNPLSAMLPGASIGKVPAMVDNVLGKLALKEATKSGKAVATTAEDIATTVSGGSRAAILNEKYIPRVQELVTKPFTPEVKQELLQIAEKLPGTSRTEIIRYIQRAERLN